MDRGVALALVLLVALAPAGANSQRAAFDGQLGSLRAGLLLVDGRPDEGIVQIGPLDLVLRDGIACDPARLRESIRGKIDR